MAASIHRHYFTPSEVGDELSCGTRSCVQACCAFLGHPPPPKGAHPYWNKILKRNSPEGCEIRSFDRLNDMNEHLDYLYVATINKNSSAGNGHAAVLYRGEDQIGSTKCHLFNPGKDSPNGHIDLNNRRVTAGWNSICAVFIPGADIPAEDKKETITILDSSDSDDEEDPLTRNRTSSTVKPASLPSSPKLSNTQEPHSHALPQLAGGGGDMDADGHEDVDGGIPSPTTPRRRNPSRATKISGTPMPSLFYKERLEIIRTRPDYSRVMQYTYNDQFNAKHCSKEMIGQHIAKYLLSRGDWVVWFHRDSSQFVIARKENFFSYDIEGAVEGESKFTGYVALAEWTFDSDDNIYQKSLESADGKAFLNGIDCDKDDLDKLFRPNISTAQKRRKKRYLTYNDGSANRKTTSRKKKKRHDDEAEQHVADFDFEEDFNANEAFSAEAAASTKDQSSVEDESGKLSEEEIRYSDHESTADYDGYDDDEEWEWTDEEEAEKQAEESPVDSQEGLKPKQVFTQAASRGSSQDNGEDDDVSDLDDDASGEKGDPNAKKDTKRQSEAEISARSNEPEGHAINDRRRREEDMVSYQDERRSQCREIEEREGERLRGERSAAALTAQEPNLDYIVELCDICGDRVAFGSKELCTKKALVLVCKDLTNSDEKTIRLAKRWSAQGKSPEEVVDGLVSMRVIEAELEG